MVHKSFTKTLIDSLINQAAKAKMNEDGDKSKKKGPVREWRPQLVSEILLLASTIAGVLDVARID